MNAVLLVVSCVVSQAGLAPRDLGGAATIDVTRDPPVRSSANDSARTLAEQYIDRLTPRGAADASATRPLTLKAILSVTPSPQERLELVKAYWDVWAAWAESQLLTGLAPENEPAGELGGRAPAVPEWQRARYSARLHELDAALAVARQKLVARGFAADALPLDPPLPTVYRTEFERLFVNRSVPDEAARLNRTLPLRLAALDYRAEAMRAAEQALEDARRTNGDTAESTLLRRDELAQAQRAFAESVRTYNQEIAQYVTAAMPGMAADATAQMLVKNPIGAPASRPAASPTTAAAAPAGPPNRTYATSEPQPAVTSNVPVPSRPVIPRNDVRAGEESWSPAGPRPTFAPGSVGATTGVSPSSDTTRPSITSAPASPVRRPNVDRLQFLEPQTTETRPANELPMPSPAAIGSVPLPTPPRAAPGAPTAPRFEPTPAGEFDEPGQIDAPSGSMRSILEQGNGAHLILPNGSRREERGPPPTATPLTESRTVFPTGSVEQARPFEGGPRLNADATDSRAPLDLSPLDRPQPFEGSLPETYSPARSSLELRSPASPAPVGGRTITVGGGSETTEGSSGAASGSSTPAAPPVNDPFGSRYETRKFQAPGAGSRYSDELGDDPLRRAGGANAPADRAPAPAARIPGGPLGTGGPNISPPATGSPAAGTPATSTPPMGSGLGAPASPPGDTSSNIRRLLPGRPGENRLDVNRGTEASGGTLDSRSLDTRSTDTRPLDMRPLDTRSGGTELRIGEPGRTTTTAPADLGISATTSDPLSAAYASIANLEPPKRAQRLAMQLFSTPAATENALPLRTALERVGGRTQQRTVAELYWRARELAGVEKTVADKLAALQALLGGTTPIETAPAAWRAARASTLAELREAQAERIAAEFRLRAAMGAPTAGEPRQPSTTPHAGRYLLYVEAQPAQVQALPAVKRAEKSVPDLHAALLDRAEAVVLADELRAETMRGRDLDASLRAVERQARETRAFLETLRRYNQAIAEYTTIVLPAGSSSADLSASMVVDAGR